MITPRTSRKKILKKLRKKVKKRIPILIASAGSGLVAKLLEKAGWNGYHVHVMADFGF